MEDDEIASIFLTLEEVLEIHKNQLEFYGGTDGILNRDALESALAQPKVMFGGRFLHSDVFEMAAVYLFHLARNHAFADGNKRVAAVAAIVFLSMNGHELNADDDELENLVIAVASGQTQRADIARFFKKNCI